MQPVIEPRPLLRIYAWVMGPLGFLLFGWGPMLLPGYDMTLVRVFGAIILSAGLAAAGLAAIEDVRSQRRALLWFAVAHLPVLLALWSQSTAIWGSGIGEHATKITFAIAFFLFYSWFSIRRHQGPSTDFLRSQYELQIRNAAVQEERGRLARDLHDSIKQQLFAIQTSAATAQTRFDTDPTGARRALEDVREAARQALSEMHAMLDQLRAAPLELSGLVSALKQQCEALGFRTGSNVEFSTGDLPDRESLPPGVSEAILRVAQEALANVAKHARARNVNVHVGTVRGALELRVSDDGAGFDTNQTTSGMGLANIRERARQFGAAYEVISHPGSGATVTFSIPIARRARPSELRTQAITAAALFVFGLLVLTQTRSVGVALMTFLAAFQTVHLLKALRTTGREAASR